MGSIANPTTHTKNSNYTDDFNGTSAATPGVSGVVALMLQANPNLTWRDVRWILAKTSRKVDTSSSSWEPAALGTSFSHMYGYGVPNASAAVASAQGFTSLSNLKSCSFTNQSSTQVVITNNSAAGKTFSLEASGCNLTIEFVEVQVNITHTYFGDLRITLTSPKNYKSYLAEPHNCTPSCSLNAYNWTFGSVRHLNETINGTWKIKVSDEGTGGAGSINIQKIVFWGH
jgi:kexin